MGARDAKLVIRLDRTERISLVEIHGQEGKGMTLSGWARIKLLNLDKEKEQSLVHLLVKGAADRGLIDPNHPWFREYLENIK